MMRSKLIVFLLLAALCVLLVVVFTSCGRSRKLTPVSLPKDAAAKSVTAQPRWLADALAKLRAMPCPMNVSPELFAQLKERLRSALIEKAHSKSACEISPDWTRVRNLEWKRAEPANRRIMEAGNLI